MLVERTGQLLCFKDLKTESDHTTRLETESRLSHCDVKGGFPGENNNNQLIYICT